MPTLQRVHVHFIMAFVLGALGFAVNLFPVNLSFGVDFVFGGVLPIIALRRYGPTSAVLAGTIANSATYFLWGHPYAALIFTLEVLTIAILEKRFRLSLLAGVCVFWALGGGPLIWFFYGQMLGLDHTATALIFVKQTLNGIFHVVIADIILGVIVAVQSAKAENRATFSLRRYLVNIFVLFAVVPIVSMSVLLSTNAVDAIDERAKTQVQSAEATVMARLRQLERHLTAIVEAQPLSDLKKGRFPEGVPDISRVVIRGEDGHVIYDEGRDNQEVLFLRDVPVELSDRRQARVSIWVKRVVLAASVQRSIDDVHLNAAIIAQNGDVIGEYPLQRQDTGSPTTTVRDPWRVTTTSSREPQALMVQWEDSVFERKSTLPWNGELELITSFSAEPFVLEYRQELLWYLSFALFLTLAAVVSALRMSRKILEPLQRLKARFGEVEYHRLYSTASDFDPNTRIAEYLDLAHQFGAMAERLAREQANTQRHRRRLERVINEAPALLYAVELNTDVVEARQLDQSVALDGGLTFRHYFVSGSIEKLLGFTASEATQNGWWSSRLHPDDRPLARSRLRRIWQDGQSTDEYRLRRKDGEYLWVVDSAQVVRDDTGVATELVGIVIDKTPQRLAEARLEQKSKLESLGEVATGLAHELNQPLNVIRTAVANLTRRQARETLDAETLKNKLERIDEQVTRAATIVTNLRVFGRADEIQYERFDCNEVAARVAQLVRSDLIVHDIGILERLSTTPALAFGDSSRLEQVLLNLVNNARDQIRYKRISQDHVGNDTIMLTTYLERLRVLIWVEDTGGGIAPEVADKMFEPFYTTKNSMEGTGLGLSLSLRFVQSMKGEIWVENAAQGARFVISLPRNSAEWSDPVDHAGSSATSK